MRIILYTAEALQRTGSHPSWLLLLIVAVDYFPQRTDPAVRAAGALIRILLARLLVSIMAVPWPDWDSLTYRYLQMISYMCWSICTEYRYEGKCS